jgi:hypothetical protein
VWLKRQSTRLVCGRPGVKSAVLKRRKEKRKKRKEQIKFRKYKQPTGEISAMA